MAACGFPEDQLEAARHAGAFLQDQLVGIVSLYPVPWQAPGGWQLRGMAVDPDHQGRGIGARLLQFVEQDRARAEVPYLWCNARTQAVRFYHRHGWRAIGEPFEIPGVGPHNRMVKQCVRMPQGS